MAAIQLGFLYARLRYGLNLHHASPWEALYNSRVPVLLIHGTADTNIPDPHSRALHTRNPASTELWEVEGRNTSKASGASRICPPRDRIIPAATKGRFVRFAQTSGCKPLDWFNPLCESHKSPLVQRRESGHAAGIFLRRPTLFDVFRPFHLPQFGARGIPRVESAGVADRDVVSAVPWMSRTGTRELYSALPMGRR